MLKRKLCSGMAARGTIDCSRLRVNGGIQRLVGQVIGDAGDILYAVSGKLQLKVGQQGGWMSVRDGTVA